MPATAAPRSLYPADPPRPGEQLLIDFWPRLKSDVKQEARVLTTTLGRGQLATTIADAQPAATVVCWFLDLYAQQQSDQQIGQRSDHFQLVCAADPPEAEFDVACLPAQKQGEVELVRDQLQIMHQRLVVGGRLVASSDNPQDTWLYDQLRAMFDKVSKFPVAGGVVYVAHKQKPLKKVKNFACEFAFRDQERLIQLRSRPSVFSHRSLDTGARALIEAMPLAAGQRVLDIGCGSGAVALAAALRLPDVQVVALDSNPRAVEATEWAAGKNEVSRVTAALDCDGRTLESATFDLALGNPPYYSNFRLPELFIQIACRALKPDGKLLLVTKMPEWYVNNLPRWFHNFEQAEVRQFHVFTCSGIVPGGK
jgi:16S rRNA G1207 methylase RsmC